MPEARNKTTVSGASSRAIRSIRWTAKAMPPSKKNKLKSPLILGDVRNHSHRSATSGSTRDALIAGPQHAVKAVRPTVITAVANVAKSVGVTSYNNAATPANARAQMDGVRRSGAAEAQHGSSIHGWDQSLRSPPLSANPLLGPTGKRNEPVAPCSRVKASFGGKAPLRTSFIETLGLDPDASDWQRLGRDWVRPLDVRARTRLYGELIAKMPREVCS